METLHFDLSAAHGGFKMLNCTNGGPWHKRHTGDQPRSTLAAFREANIPFQRNHDSSFCAIYGGPFSHDVSRIFPDFSADENDPASYDFACTDESILVSLEAGTRTFFRLGEAIENQVKKHNTLPPADYRKWALVCEHIIRHYTEGWADGFTLDMPYWEIWNEPDLDGDASTNKRTWGGTRAQFYEFYAVAASHLKACFPHLKIGGPAIAGAEMWSREFLTYMREHDVPVDFWSWHIYPTEPRQVTEKARRMRDILDECGFSGTESILDEWNYIKGFAGNDFTDSVRVIHGEKGAAFTMAVITAAQSAPIDMLMYYDVRPSVYNGCFDFYTCEKLPTYYALAWYGKLYGLSEVRADGTLPGIHSLCGVDGDGKATAIITRYADGDTDEVRDVRLEMGEGRYKVTYLDGTTAETDEPLLRMKRDTIVLVTEI